MQGFRGAKQEMVERQAFRLSQAITVNAHAVKDFLISRKVPAEKIVVTYNGLDFDRLQTAPDRSRSQKCCELGLPDDNGLRFVSIVANLRHDVKNIPMFLRAAKIISERYPDVRFVIAGEGQLEGQLKRMASELGVDGKCLFIGRCGNVPDLLSVSEICVLSSFYEGFSNSILEYMAASKPVVATDVGGAAEAIAEGVSGFLVQSDDHTAMAERIESLIADPETGQKMGEKGREIIETRFSTAAQLNQITALYESLLSKH
jgi:glycosyltransferase involved in cell wall biosynthesis